MFKLDKDAVPGGTESETHRSAEVIPRSVRIRGTVTSAVPLTIEGEVDGTVVVPQQTLIVTEMARIRADLYARRVVLAGQMEGSVVATRRIEIGRRARIDADLSTPSLVLEDGATFRGQVDHVDIEPS